MALRAGQDALYQNESDEPEGAGQDSSEEGPTLSEIEEEGTSGYKRQLRDFGFVFSDEMYGGEQYEVPKPTTIPEAVQALHRAVQHHTELMEKKLISDSQIPEPISVEPEVEPCDVREDRVEVHVRVVFLKIGEIDTLKENFHAEAFIQARWREPLFDGHKDIHQEHIQWDKHWSPKLFIENSIGDPKEQVWHNLVFNQKGEATVYERRRLKGCFVENLELNKFPFDTQDLTLALSSERSEEEIDLQPDTVQISCVNVQSFVDEQEWRLHTHVETWTRITERIYDKVTQNRYPAVCATCRASRRPAFFVWNVFLIMLAICSLTFATFSVDQERPENRLQLSFILLLTNITFKFVVGQTLPRVPYLTYLDKYILTSIGILCSVCVWHSIVPMLQYNHVLSRSADKIALIVLWTSYLLFHICFFVYICFEAYMKNVKYSQKDKAHKEYMKGLQEQEGGNVL